MAVLSTAFLKESTNAQPKRGSDLIEGVFWRDNLYTVGTLAAREAHYLVPTSPGVQEVTLKPIHLPGPTNREGGPT